MFDRVIASSGPVELSEGAMVVSGVTVSLQRKGMSRGTKIAIGAAIGVGVLLLVLVQCAGTDGIGICAQ